MPAENDGHRAARCVQTASPCFPHRYSTWQQAQLQTAQATTLSISTWLCSDSHSASAAEDQAYSSASDTPPPSPSSASLSPGSAAAASSAGASSPCDSSPATKRQWTPLPDYLVRLLMTEVGAPSREEAEACLSVELLLQLPNIHTYLSDHLRHLKVGAAAGPWHTSTSCTCIANITFCSTCACTLCCSLAVDPC